MALLKITIFLILTFLFITLQSCYTHNVDDCTQYDYSDCITKRPDSAIVRIKYTVSRFHPSVPLQIFKGKIDNNLLIYSDTLTDGLLKILLPVNEYYSARVYYINPGDTIIAIDGDKLKLWKEHVCDSVCWSTNEPVIDLRLKR